MTPGLLKCELHTLRKAFIVKRRCVWRTELQRTRSRVQHQMVERTKNVAPTSRSYSTGGNCFHIFNQKYKWEKDFGLTKRKKFFNNYKLP